jgi:hypothetical protein
MWDLWQTRWWFGVRSARMRAIDRRAGITSADGVMPDGTTGVCDPDEDDDEDDDDADDDADDK